MRIVFLFLAFIGLAAQAQEITEQNLAGKWTMCAFDINGIYWDFRTDAIKLPAEYEGLGTSQKEALIADIKGGLADYKDGTFLIKGNYIQQSMGGKDGSGTFTIEKKDGLHYLKVINDDPARTVDMLQVELKDSKMYISLPDEIGGTSTLIYCK